MHIIDKNGYKIEVTDLEEAIRIAKRFTKYRHADKEFTDFDKRQNAYWVDMHEKLIIIELQRNAVKD